MDLRTNSASTTDWLRATQNMNISAYELVVNTQSTQSPQAPEPPKSDPQPQQPSQG
jgi:hypothetical protein